MPCYLVHGTDEYRIAQRVDELLDAAEITSEMNLHEFDLELNPDAFPEAVECAFTPPFIGGRRVVAIGGIGRLERKVRAALDDDDSSEGHLPAAEIAGKLEKLPDFSYVVIYDRLRKLDGRGKLYKTLSSFCKVDEYKPLFFDPLASDNRQLEEWLNASASEHGIKLTPSGMRELAMRLGSDLRCAEREMEKLRLAYGENSRIGADEVADVTPPSTAHSIFNLCDALGQGKLDAALGFLQGMLAAKSPPPYILTMLARHVRNLAIAKKLSDAGRPDKELQEILGMKNRWVFNRFMPQVRRFRGDYSQAHGILTACDDQLKTSALDPKTALEICVVRLSTMMESSV